MRPPPRLARTPAEPSMAERHCSECGRKLDGLMSVDADKPGFAALLQGEGEDPLLKLCAWVFSLGVIFALAIAMFSVLAP
jgi:hypothetical protein